MKKVRDVMATQFPVATGSMSVRSALSLMREHGIESIPVVEDGELRGVTSYLELSSYHPNRLLFDVQLLPPVAAAPEMSLAAAYDLVDGQHLTHLPVVSEDRLVGMISLNTIQHTLGISTDPLTGLPWANALRERAAAHLAHGHEIIVLFMDIDNFRTFNKEYGHVVGDRVIVGVAGALLQCVDPTQDFACRYAGDEFAVVTTRTLKDAEALAEKIRTAVSQIRVEGMGHPITASVGVCGGRRTKEREGTHYAATVDDLINLASKASTKAKPHAAAAGEQAPLPAPAPRAESTTRPAIAGLKLRSTGTRVEVEVKLSRGDVVRTGSATGTANAQSIMRLVAESTLQAANLFMPEGYQLVPETVERVRIAEEKALIVSVVTLSGPDIARTLAGAVVIKEDIYRTVVEATLHAINRFLARPSLLTQAPRPVAEG